MFSFDYGDWKIICLQIFKQDKSRMRLYLQWYPFAQLSLKERELLLSEEFFNEYIKSGLFLYYSENWLITNNFIFKSDGNLRHASLVSPIMYLVSLLIGKSISKKYQSNRPSTVKVYYSGNFDENRIYYKKDYDIFFKTLNSLTQNYKYFIKTDIEDFYSNINVNILFDLINTRFAETNVKVNQKDLLVYKELLLCLGHGELPLIENGTASSYLATIVYLETPDIKLHSYITNKEPHITDFVMVRYVDDLYILFNSDLSDNIITPIVNRILNTYASELKKLNLSLNREKTTWKYTENINEELKKSLYAEQYYGKKFNIIDFVDSKRILRFLQRIKNSLYNYTLDTKKYRELVNEEFKILNAEYTPLEIFNSLLYKEHSLFKNIEIIDSLLTLISFDYSFLKLDPKRFIVMLLKTKDENLIKTMLSKLFDTFRKETWNIYDTTLSVNYLLQRGFCHSDLLNILKNEEESIYLYYEYFCKLSFISSLNKSKHNYIRKFWSSIFYKKDDKLFILYFMYMVELRKNNYLAAFAYYKSFFDRISAHFAYNINGNDRDSGKPNYKGYYEKSVLIKLYEGIDNAQKIIEKAHKLRNSNPLAHASAELLNRNDSVDDILSCIKKLEYLIETKIQQYDPNHDKANAI